MKIDAAWGFWKWIKEIKSEKTVHREKKGEKGRQRERESFGLKCFFLLVATKVMHFAMLETGCVKKSRRLLGHV